MNTIIQNILVFTIAGLAILFLIKKFIWKPRKKASNPDSSRECGNDGCGC